MLVGLWGRVMERTKTMTVISDRLHVINAELDKLGFVATFHDNGIIVTNNALTKGVSLKFVSEDSFTVTCFTTRMSHTDSGCYDNAKSVAHQIVSLF